MRNPVFRGMERGRSRAGDRKDERGVKMGGYNEIQVLEALQEIARELKKIRESLEKEGKERE